MNRFAQLQRARRAPPGQHRSAEAFCLTWDACKCGHRERIWNSRNGVTPFSSQCPSCNQPALMHWPLDSDAPDHQPAHGQRVWTTLTHQRAEQIAEARLSAAFAMGRLEGLTPEQRLGLVESIFHTGEAPDLVVTGYVLETKP